MVPLGLVERKKPSKPQGDISPEQGSELYKETEITKTFEHDAFLEEVLKQQNTPKSQGKRIAIIGEPGAGKTTLLQQIANWVSREIHQSIVIWVSVADLREKELKSYLFDSWLTQVAEKTGKAEPTEQLKNDFVALFNQNNVWLLLDGLDEMSASSGNPLTEIARQFREVGLISQARIVLTCRVNLWDGSSNALDDFDTYRTLDFSYPEQVERFIAKWFTATPEIGEQLCSALKESGKERIRDLVKNPLRLTLLCLNWQSGEGKLPDTQAGLYQQFVDDFNKWKKEEFTTTSEQRQQLNVKLGELAKEAIDKQATRFRLRQDFVSQFLGDADDANSLLKLALNRGWLNCVGIDTNRKPVYAFFHASFQEYFAAIAINDWDFFLPREHKNQPVKDHKYRIFEPQWKQTILLWLGREEENLKQQKQQFIEALLNFQDASGKSIVVSYNEKLDFLIFTSSMAMAFLHFLLPLLSPLFPLLYLTEVIGYFIWKSLVGKGFYECQAYFLAAAGIAEFKDYVRADEIARQIVKWVTGDLFLIQEEAELVLQQIDRTKAIAALVQLLQSKTVDKSTRWKAAGSLEKIGTGNENAIAALVQLLESTTVNDDTRMWAADSLGKIDPGNEFAIAALVQLLQSKTVNDDTRMQAGESLEKIGIGNEFAINALVQLLQSKNDNTRRQAAYSLGTIGTGNKNAIAALVQLLQSTTVDKSTRMWAANSLGKIGIGNEFAINALVQLLQSTTVDKSTRMWAAYSLGTIDPGNEIAINALVQLLQSDATHMQAAYSLGTIDPGNEIAINALVQLLQSTTVHDYTRREAAESLGTIDPGNEIAINALVQLLQSKNDNTRRRAAYSLERIGIGNGNAINALVQLLQSTTVHDYTRREAAESLWKIDPGNEIAINALVQLLQSKDDYTRRRAVHRLGEIGRGNEKVFAIWVQQLQSTTEDGYTHWQAGDSLGTIDPGNEKAINVLVQLLQSTTVSSYNRWDVADSLKKIIQNKHRFEVVKALRSYLLLGEECHKLVWECAQNMPYPDFYQAWHQHNLVTRTMRSLKRILFTRII
ncbi:HEAT repeat domain-containing protein [Nostoc sp.]|uniref:HEAT repeat domain-containing protein n=1 Tax=Nostoc sp. TaxID=1180 RepID=UPI002FFA1683